MSKPIFINIADLRDPKDTAGRSYRQVNAEKSHGIAVGTLVEIRTEEGGGEGVRMYVVSHGRDCDMTPLYYLSADKHDTEERMPGFRNPGWTGGFSEDSLSIVPMPKKKGKAK